MVPSMRGFLQLLLEEVNFPLLLNDFVLFLSSMLFLSLLERSVRDSDATERNKKSDFVVFSYNFFRILFLKQSSLLLSANCAVCRSLPAQFAAVCLRSLPQFACAVWL